MEQQHRPARRGPGRRVALILALLALAVPSAAQATGTLDQQLTSFGSARGLIGTHDTGVDVRHAQVFRAGVTGTLDQVDLPVRVVGDPGVSLKVEITDLDGAGHPATVLGSATVVQSGIPACDTLECISLQPTSDFTTFAFTVVPLTVPAPVTAGVSYAIVLSATGAQLDIYGDRTDRTSNRYEWAATNDVSAYADGDGLSYTGGVGWGPSNADKAFKTYVGAGRHATVQPPINTDGSSNFKAGRGVVPIKFTLSVGGSATCDLAPATIALTKTSGTDAGPINEPTYLLAADTGSSFRVTDCQYVYNLNAKSLAAGTYLATISIDSQVVGSASFDLR